MDQRKAEKVRLLWTGGWDSTFRLLQLLIIYKRPVQTYYIIDPDRKSTGHELRAMQRIRRKLREKYPDSTRLLFPTKYVEKEEIKKNISITKAYEHVRNTIAIGSQYEFLARFADQYRLNGLELSLEKGRGELDKARILFADLLDRILAGIDDEGAFNYEVDGKFRGRDYYQVFHYFRFPLRDLDKVEMEKIAKENDFYDLMEITWFCHNPLSNGAPCGTCTPCVLTVKEGLGYRLPVRSRVRYNLRMVLSKERFKEASPGIYKILRKTKEFF